MLNRLLAILLVVCIPINFITIYLGLSSNNIPMALTGLLCGFLCLRGILRHNAQVKTSQQREADYQAHLEAAKRDQSDQGFTLVELLIVCSLIGALLYYTGTSKTVLQVITNPVDSYTALLQLLGLS